MNKKTLAIILSIALAIGAFAGLSFNLFTASAVEYVGDGTNVAYHATGADTSDASVFSAGITACYLQGTTEKKGANISGLRATGAGQDGDGYYAKPDTSSHWTAASDAWRNLVVFYSGKFGTTEVGSKYYVSAYVRLQAAATDVKAYFSTADLSGRLHATSRSQKGEEVTLSTEWTKVEWVVENKDAAKDVFIGLVLTKAASVDFDNISIQKAVEAPKPVGDGTEMVTDGKAPATAGDTVFLGSQKIAHWYTDGGSAMKNIGQDSVAGTDADGNGRYFAVAKIDSKASSLPTLRDRQVFTMAIDGFVAGNKYIVSAYAKLPAGSTGTVNAHLATCATYQTQVSEGDSYLTHKSDVVALTTEWQEIVLVIDYAGPGDGTKGTGDKYLGLVVDAPAAVDVDAISIQKIGAPAQDDDDDQQGGAQTQFTENLIYNNSLQDGKIEPFSDPKGANADDPSSLGDEWDLELVTTDSQDGDGYCVKVLNRTVKHATAKLYVQDIIKAYGAGKYTYTAYVKAANAGETFNYQPLIQMVWGEAYTTENVNAGTTVGKWSRSDAITVNSTEWKKVTVTFEITPTADSAKLKDLELRQCILYGQEPEFNPLFAKDILLDNVSLIKEINGNENQDLIDKLPTGKPASGNAGNNAGSSNTGDVLPVALIAVAVISAGALVIVARRKRED